MKNLFAAFSLSFFAFLANAQKVVNDPNAEERKVDYFHSIDVSGSIKVVLTQGSATALAVSAGNKENVAEIRTEVKNGVLHISFSQKNKWAKNPGLKAYIAVKELKAIRGSGAADFVLEGSIQAPDLRVQLSGASDLKGKLIVGQKLDLLLSGASDVAISGSAADVTINANGASDVTAFGFKAGTCSVKASGASDIHITVEGTLDAEVSGASSLTYKGNPVTREIKSSGAGSIRKS